jgi:two-component system OmpR family response regulator
MPSSPSVRLLYVDDDRDGREMLSMLLDLSRIETKAVASGKEALNLMQAERFDLYLLDLWLPDIDGLELCQRMRSIDPQAPIVFFSGAADIGDHARGLAAGATAYVSKPNVDGLLQTIAQLTSQTERCAA